MASTPLQNRLTVYRINKAVPYILQAFTYIVLISISFVFLYPYLYMVSTSFKSYSDIINITEKWIPRQFTLENYSVAAQAMNFVRSGMNTVFVACVATVGHCFVCSFVGYGFARFRFPLKKVLFFIVILSIVVPVQTIIIPTYLEYVRMGIVNTYLPMLLPTFLGYGLKGGLFILLFNQYYIRLPKALEEAANIDGCGPVKTYFRIALPTSASTMVVCIVLSLVWHWNDFFEPSIYLSNSNMWLLPQMLPEMYSLINSLQQSTDNFHALMQFKYHEGVAMAGTVICTLPVLVMYIFMQRKFMQSVERSGLVE